MLSRRDAGAAFGAPVIGVDSLINAGGIFEAATIEDFRVGLWQARTHWLRIARKRLATRLKDAGTFSPFGILLCSGAVGVRSPQTGLVPYLSAESFALVDEEAEIPEELSGLRRFKRIRLGS